MTARTFAKRLATPEAAETAAAHHHWLDSLGSGVALPALLGRTGTTLEFEHVAGPTAGAEDLTLVADALGQLHRAARRHLGRIGVNRPYRLDDARTIDGFAPPRRPRLHTALVTVPSPLPRRLVDACLDVADALPAALYKDTNPRNVIVSPERGPVLVDFDTLTLAPVGYDLAKIVVTTAMAYGPVPRRRVLDALQAYNDAIGTAGRPNCPMGHIQTWAEFHHLLTRPWLGSHYRYDWSALRPWPASEAVAAARMLGTIGS